MKTKRRCSTCGGYCGGTKRNCRHAENEAKKQSDQLWSYVTAGMRNKKS